MTSDLERKHHVDFTSAIADIMLAYGQLLDMHPLRANARPSPVPAAAGVYLLSEPNLHLYVGRTRNLRRRLRDHSSPSANHHQATLAIKIARIETQHDKPTYQSAGSTTDLLSSSSTFRTAFDDAKARIRAMQVRYVEEQEPVRQALLEIYAAVELGTYYNSFETT